MSQTIVLPKGIFFVKEEYSDETFILSYNKEKKTRTFSTLKGWEKASEKFPIIEDIDEVPDLLTIRDDIDDIIADEEWTQSQDTYGN